jgi:hypothetical protein
LHYFDSNYLFMYEENFIATGCRQSSLDKKKN